MDTPEKPRRPWWLRKRFRAAALLIMAYPFGLWPVTYLMALGSVPSSEAVAIAYYPVLRVIYIPGGVRPGFEWFVDGLRYFSALGQRHREAESTSN